MPAGGERFAGHAQVFSPASSGGVVRWAGLGHTGIWYSVNSQVARHRWKSSVTSTALVQPRARMIAADSMAFSSVLRLRSSTTIAWSGTPRAGRSARNVPPRRSAHRPHTLPSTAGSPARNPGGRATRRAACGGWCRSPPPNTMITSAARAVSGPMRTMMIASPIRLRSPPARAPPRPTAAAGAGGVPVLAAQYGKTSRKALSVSRSPVVRARKAHSARLHTAR